MNVILLTADSLSAPYFKTETSSLAGKIRGVEFSNAFASAADTASAMPGLSTGVMCDDIDGLGLADEGPPMPLAGMYQDKRYNTALWTDNDLFGPTYNYDRGFESGNLGSVGLKKRIGNLLVPQTAGELNAPESDNGGLKSSFFKTAESAYFDVYKRFRDKVGLEENFYRSAASLNDAALNWLKEKEGEDNFLWIHYMDTHHPYEPPTEYFSSLDLNGEWSRAEMSLFSRRVIKSNNTDITPGEMEDIRTVYSACCKYLSDEISTFLERLLAKGLVDLDRDVLAFSADHGECLVPENEMLGHVPPAFWEDIVHVPLIIARPDWEQGVFDEQVSTLGLMPTLLKASGIDPPKTTRKGGADSPDEMAVEIAKFASKRLLPGKRTRVYQGARNHYGQKVFGAHLRGKDFELQTRVNGESEIVVTKRDIEIKQEADTVAQDFEGLLQSIKNRGGAVDTRSDTIDDSEEVRDHLADLGYLE